MVLDLSMILIIALFTFVGYKQGLVKTAIKILSFFIALVISLSLYKTVTNIIINRTTVDDKIEKKIIAKILPEKYEEKLELLPDTLAEKGENTINETAIFITEKVLSIIVFILMFLVLKIVLRFVSVLTSLITKLPIIKQIDKTGGIIYGFAKGIIIVITAFAAIALISPLIDIKYIQIINNSILGSMLYNHNLLLS